MIRVFYFFFLPFFYLLFPTLLISRHPTDDIPDKLVCSFFVGLQDAVQAGIADRSIFALLTQLVVSRWGGKEEQDPGRWNTGRRYLA